MVLRLVSTGRPRDRNRDFGRCTTLTVSAWQGQGKQGLGLWRTTCETFSFGAGELPTDGFHSLICAVHVGAACASTDVEVNSPTNFDGVSGSVSPCSSCPTDVDGNGQTDAFDLANLLGAWGPVSPDSACLDADGDGIIAAFDLAVVLGAWGPCP